MSKNDEKEIEFLDAIFMDEEDEQDLKEQEEIQKNHMSKKSGKVTYEKVKGKDGQFIKGLRKKLVDGKLWGYEMTFCYGYQDTYDKKTRRMVHKQIKERKSFTNKEKAIQWYNGLAKEKSDLEDIGKRIIKEGYTLLEVCDLYYEDRKAAKRGKGYLQQLRIQKDHFETFFIGDKQYVKKLTTQDMIDYFRYEEGRGYCKESIAKYKSHLKLMWDFMLRNSTKYQVKENVVAPAPVQADESEFESVALNYLQIEDYLNEVLQIEDLSYLYLFVFAYTMGFRRGELAGLQWRDINWEEKKIIICHNRVQRTKKDMESDGYDDVDERGVKLPKRNKVRTVELHKVAYDTLILYKEYQEGILKRKVKGDEFVLQFELNLVNGYNPNVSKISVRWSEFRDRVNKKRLKSGDEPLERCRLHDGRETCGTLMLDGVKKADGTFINAVNRYQVYAALGHSYQNVEKNTTEKIYHLITEERWDVTRFWNELITIDVNNYYNTYKQIRDIETESLREEKRLKLNEAKRKRYEKAKQERNAAKDEYILLNYDDDEEDNK